MDEIDEMDTDLKIRTPQQVAQRLLALIAVVDQVYHPGLGIHWVKNKGIEAFFSPGEQAFYFAEQPAQEQRVDTSWRAEAMAALIWSLKGLEHLPDFSEPFNAMAHPMVHAATEDAEAFIAAAQLRPDEELEAMEAFLYHQHWRVRNRDLGFLAPDYKEDTDPELDDLHPGVVYERRYAMSWLVGHGDCWDEVPTDT